LSPAFRAAVDRHKSQFDTRGTYLNRMRVAAVAATVDPEVRQMSPRYLRYLFSKREHGLTWLEYKAAHPCT
jgi:hypothetical protein